MLNNVKYHFAQRGDWQRALEMLDHQLGLAPTNPTLLLEQGDFWLRLGAPEFARRAYAEALGRSTDEPAVAALAKERLGRLPGGGQTLH
jgi:regulator of sirC expression with transglutaminase-like and TPR domain